MQAPSEFNAVGTAKTLLREARNGAIATHMGGSQDPYCSLVNVATAGDGSPLLLISALAVHTKNLQADKRVSLLLAARGEGDPLERPRVTLQGRAEVTTDAAEKRRFLTRHPGAEAYAGFKDFAFYRIAPTAAHLVAGFGRIVDLTWADLRTDTADAQPLLDQEDDICSHMNMDHADTMRLYASALLGAPERDWTCVGCDPEGLDMQAGDHALRLPFPQPVKSPGVLRQTLKGLADQARQMRP
jgi:heme iron utilization protein